MPGERIGPWTLDARLNDFIKAYGERRYTTQLGPPLNPGHVQHEFIDVQAGGFWGIVVVDRGTSKLVRIGTFNNSDKTAGGLQVGCLAADIERLVGRPPDLAVRLSPTRRLLLYDVGIGITVDDGTCELYGRITDDTPKERTNVHAVSVFRPGAARTLLASPPQ